MLKWSFLIIYKKCLWACFPVLGLFLRGSGHIPFYYLIP